MTEYNLMLCYNIIKKFNKHINYINTDKFSFSTSGAKYKNIRQQHLSPYIFTQSDGPKTFPAHALKSSMAKILMSAIELYSSATTN